MSEACEIFSPSLRIGGRASRWGLSVGIDFAEIGSFVIAAAAEVEEATEFPNSLLSQDLRDFSLTDISLIQLLVVGKSPQCSSSTCG